MSTRVATHTDTQEVVRFLENYHKDSNMQDIPFDKMSMAQALDYYIGMPKHIVFVYENSEHEIDGVLMGGVEPFMFNKKRKWATDLVHVANSGGPWLMKRFFAWAKLHKVDRVIMGISTADSRTDELYKALGMEPLGGMYSLNLNKE